MGEAVARPPMQRPSTATGTLVDSGTVDGTTRSTFASEPARFRVAQWVVAGRRFLSWPLPYVDEAERKS